MQSFQTRDKKGRSAGIVLEKFSSFNPVLTKRFSKEFSSIDKLKIKPKTAAQTSIQKIQSQAAQTQPVFASPCAGRENRCGSR